MGNWIHSHRNLLLLALLFFLYREGADEVLLFALGLLLIL